MNISNPQNPKQTSWVVKFKYFIFILIVAIGLISIVATSHDDDDGGGGGDDSIIKTYVPISLGNHPNNVKVNEVLFLGHRIDSFRIKVRFSNPGRVSHWLPGVTLRFRTGSQPFQVLESLPTSADNNGYFWSDFTHGNRIWISLSSRGRVNFEGGQPLFEIVSIQRYYKANSGREDIPSGGNENILALTRGYEAIGYSPGLNEAQHFTVSTWSYVPQLFSIYVSPFEPELWNDTGIKISVSFTGFKHINDETGWIKPELRDSGIYHEIFIPPKTTSIFITVKSVTLSPYFFTIQKVGKIFNGLVLERDSKIGPPKGTNQEELTNRTSVTFPYGKQIGYFLQPEPHIDARIREMTVMTSAKMLDASDGLFRISNVDLYKNISAMRPVDVQFKSGSGRANASATKITMFEVEELQDPLSGSWTFHHEWGHYEYNMPDEYVDVYGPPPEDFSLAIDPNSLMGTSRTNEFCHKLNHVSDVEPEPGEDVSMWGLLTEQYNVLPSLDAGGINQGRYLDVLKKLDDLTNFEIKN